MKRWIVFGLVALAVVVLVSPGIVGMLAERNLRSSITRVEHDNDGLVVTEERFERGWFTAAGRHRIELTERVFETADIAPNDQPGSDGSAALIVDTRIDHGLVPVTSMARDAGSLQPALASTISTLSLELGDGPAGEMQVVELPGHLYSRIGLTGATDSRYELAAGSFGHEDVELEWRGADLRFSIDAGGSELDYRGRIEPLAWTRSGHASSIGVIEFEGDQQKTAYGFSTGEVSLRVQDAALASAVAGSAGGFAKLALDARNELADERVDGHSSIDVEQLRLPGLGAVDLGLDVSVAGLDAPSLQRIRDTLAAARDAGELDGAGGVYPRIEDDLQSLLAAGARLTVERFVLAMPQGDVHATLALDLPATRQSPEFSWPALLLALKASADLRVPAALLDLAEALNPEQVRMLIATGILQREGDAYVMKAEYAQGLVTVNGAPMPLPLGLFPPPGRTSAND